MAKPLSSLSAKMTSKERKVSNEIYVSLKKRQALQKTPEGGARPAKTAKPRAAGRRSLKRA